MILPTTAEMERVVLVGFMGSGKTTVGAALARLMGWDFLDMDQRIEARAGLSVAEIFRQRGEPFFRSEEGRLALEVAALQGHVIAAGGGAFAMPDTRTALQAGAVTVWLECPLETVLARIGVGQGRPLAASRETIRKMFTEREAAYRLADLTVDASPGPGEVARRIADTLEARGAWRRRPRG
jgi:shikimate kinase